MVVRTLGMAITLGALAGALRAQSNQVLPEASRDIAVKRAVAMRTSSAPRIDGRLDDVLWRDARWISEFTQREPQEGAPATLRTEVAFAFDDDALYVAARMESDSAGVRALVTRRDREGSSEQLIVSLDTYHDRRTAYSFGVTAAGVRLDYYHGDDNRASRDYTFDPVWSARTRVEADGWTAELRIPFSQLRFSSADTLTWGINVVRSIPSRNEEDYWVLVGRRESGWASRFGQIDGLAELRGTRRLEIAPYVASDARVRGAPERANPFDEKRTLGARAGADLKVGLGPSLTLEATFNPDFGQVEADPAEVNLSAYETFFAERRPFFVEGSQLLTAIGAGWFYSRRVGAPPRGRAPGDFQEVIPNTTILGAAKVTGRLASRLSIGAFAAVTGRERARGWTAESGNSAPTEVEPRTGYGVLRLQQEFGRSASNIGVIATAVQRDFGHGSALPTLLPRQAFGGAVDWNLRSPNSRYVLFGAIGSTRVIGDSLAIARIQSSPVHFFQRPDASHVELDPARESLDGFTAQITAVKNAGRVVWSAGAFAESPGFDPNDAGRLGTADDRGVSGRLRFRQTTPGKRYHSYEIGVQNFTEWNFGGVRQVMMNALFANATWKNFWSTSVDVNHMPRDLADDLTRGGPLMMRPSQLTANMSVSSSPSRKTRWTAYASGFVDDANGTGGTLGSTLTVRPGTRWELSADPRYHHSVGSRQFVASLDGGSPATFGRRYVFSAIERSELSARLRLNYALTPDLTLETYVEPFVASGRFYDHGELPSAGAYDVRRYGTDGTTIRRDEREEEYVVTDGASSFTLPARDFNLASFRSNVVARWEWRPGSTLFLVWQQNRARRSLRSSLVQPGGWWDALTTPGDNVVAVKLSYWIGS
jgi:hypothetical protein